MPIVGAFFDPERRRTVTGGDEPREYGKVADLTIGVPKRVDVIAARNDAWDRSNPKPIGALWLVRRDDSKVEAYSASCPHLGCAIGFDAASKSFTCPCHDSTFALADGERQKGPTPRGLDPLPVEIKDGKVSVTYVRYVQGAAKREKA